MKKSVLFSLVCFSFIYGAGFVHPLPLSSRSTENGGTLSAIDAYQDGVGAMVIENGRGIDNSAMNILVFKYGNLAKDNGVILGDEVLLTGTAEDKLLAGKLYPDGGICTDGDNLTQGETWLAGICQGGLIPDGTSCDDHDTITINDMYVNQICIGKIISSPLCSDISMNWNTSTKLCEKNVNSTYAAVNTLVGYTISADSVVAGPSGIQKNGNTFRTVNVGAVGTYVYLKPDGTLSASSLANYVNISTATTGFNFRYSAGPTPINVVKSGTSLVASALDTTQGIPVGFEKIDANTFRFRYGSGASATISWVPFYSGVYTCPSGGMLSGTTCTITTLQTASGICQSGYTLNTTLGKCIQN